MAHIDTIRNGIIDKLLAISDKEYLNALLRLLEGKAIDTEKIQLSEEQKLMLQMSEHDIQNGHVISQAELDKADRAWLKEK
jgi:hypothetical protein